MAKTNSKVADQDFLTLLLDTFKLIKQSWEGLLTNIGTFILLGVVPAAVIFLSVLLLITQLLAGGGWKTAITMIALIIIVAIVMVCIFLPAITVAQLASAKNQEITFSKAFKKGSKYILKFIGLSILVGLCVIIGSILLVIPGLLAAFFFSMSFYILIDKNTGVIDSMKQSFELVKQNWMPVLALFVVNACVSAVGYVPYVGTLANLILAVAYFCLPAIIYTKIAKN